DGEFIATAKGPHRRREKLAKAGVDVGRLAIPRVLSQRGIEMLEPFPCLGEIGKAVVLKQPASCQSGAKHLRVAAPEISVGLERRREDRHRRTKHRPEREHAKAER